MSDPRFRLPDNFPLPDRLVHIAKRAFVLNSPTEVFVTCLGMLRDFRFPDWEDADWRDWIVPDDTPVTCLVCLAQEGQ